MAQILVDNNETEYIVPDGADLTKINGQIMSALSLIITGNFTGNLSHFPNIRKLLLTENAKYNTKSALLEQNYKLTEIIDKSINHIYF